MYDARVVDILLFLDKEGEGGRRRELVRYDIMDICLSGQKIVLYKSYQ